MIPSPRSYSPAKGITPYLGKRKNELLSRLLRYRYLTQGEYDEAMMRPVAFGRVEKEEPPPISDIDPVPAEEPVPAIEP